MKPIITAILALALVGIPARADETWLLKSDRIDVGGATLELNNAHPSQEACEKERKKVVDYLQEMQPGLVPLMKARCIPLITPKEGDGNG